LVSQQVLKGHQQIPHKRPYVRSYETSNENEANVLYQYIIEKFIFFLVQI
jgi:hypothetical protein